MQALHLPFVHIVGTTCTVNTLQAMRGIHRQRQHAPSSTSSGLVVAISYDIGLLVLEVSMVDNRRARRGL